MSIRNPSVLLLDHELISSATSLAQQETVRGLYMTP
jgi:hypothetical protein